MITQSDLTQITAKGIDKISLEEQLERFAKGFEPLNIVRPATVADGIVRLDDTELEASVQEYERAIKQGVSVAKFVPASGAATRMFKDLFSYLDNPADLALLSEKHPVRQFIEQAHRFAFFPLLTTLVDTDINDIDHRRQHAVAVISALLESNGLNYGFLPKGLVHFHRYGDQIRTSMEEHLVEGALYVKDSSERVRIHFTISPQHEEYFRKQLDAAIPGLKKTYGILPEVSFSFQKPHTDTLAAGPDNRPFRDEEGKLLFRPGGHGALIENLNEQETEIVFIKNIDNVVPEHLLGSTVRYKKALGGLLIKLRKSIFNYLTKLETSSDNSLIDEISTFLQDELYVQLPDSFKALGPDQKAEYLRTYLNRPIRVCGMVKNVGEPGGGPFWIREKNGQESLQILESSQFDLSNAAQKAVFNSATHFNPVDLVCSLFDYKGRKFDLKQYTNPETGFISEKSYNGRPLKALELPGLWNGAMASWITLFVEVPLSTFNPVKVVNDLLRSQHQPA